MLTLCFADPSMVMLRSTSTRVFQPGLDRYICANDILLLNRSGIDLGRSRLRLTDCRRHAFNLASC
jgi:hypothetical protein